MQNPSPSLDSVPAIAGRPNAHRVPLALCAGSGHALAWLIGVVTASNAGLIHSQWWHIARVLLGSIPAAFWLQLLLWAITTGVMLSVGTRQRALHSFWPWVAALAGAAVPYGLTLLTSILSRLWPGSESPADKPLLTLALVAYSLFIPWLLGRLMTRSGH
jgi:hypothetical protein